MSQRIKKVVQNALKDDFEGVEDMLIVSVAGVDAITDGRIRASLQEKNMRLRVVKNRLASRVFRDLGMEVVADQLAGPSAVIWGGESIVDLAKEIAEFDKNNEAFKIRGGAADGKGLSPNDVEVLSKIPGKDELIGLIAGQLIASGARVAGMVMSPGGQVAGQVQSLAEREEE